MNPLKIRHLCALSLGLTLFLMGPALAQANDLDDNIGRVNRAGYNAREMCSGTLIAPDLVLTAAHCVVFADGRPKQVTDIVFVSGWNGTSHKGTSRAKAVQLHPNAWKNSKLDPRYDLAVITLHDALSAVPLPLGDAAQGLATIKGYRGSRPHRLSTETGCGLTQRATMIALTCKAEAGQSGGPVLQNGKLVGVLSLATPTGASAAKLDDWVVSSLVKNTP